MPLAKGMRRACGIFSNTWITATAARRFGDDVNLAMPVEEDHCPGKRQTQAVAVPKSLPDAFRAGFEPLQAPGAAREVGLSAAGEKRQGQNPQGNREGLLGQNLTLEADGARIDDRLGAGQSLPSLQVQCFLHLKNPLRQPSEAFGA